MYDELMEGYEYIIHPTQALVYEFTKHKQSIDLLELGCGTGEILKVFPSQFTLYGLDIAPGMLAIARKKIKRATFVEGDMSNFRIAKKFDVIICVFDSINHLLKFHEWEETFRLAAAHMKKGGIFIFDMNTAKRHKALVTMPAYIKRVKDKLIVFKILQKAKNVYADRTQVFSNFSGEKVDLFEENVLETSFPTKKVMEAVERYFIIEKMLDPFREKVTKDTGRIFFACRKRSQDNKKQLSSVKR